MRAVRDAVRGFRRLVRAAGSSCGVSGFSRGRSASSAGWSRSSGGLSRSSSGWADDLWADPGARARGQKTCARVRELVRVADDSRTRSGEAVRASGHLCAHPCVCAAILRACSSVPTICAGVRRLVRASAQKVRAEDRWCAENITCASGRGLVREFGTQNGVVASLERRALASAFESLMVPRR